MKFQLGLWILLCFIATTAALAKPSLPVQLSSRTLTADSAALKVSFTAEAHDVIVTVRATGTAAMPPQTRRFARVAKGDSFEFSPVTVVKGSLGGVAVHVDGVFAEGRQVRALSLTLTDPEPTPSSVRGQTKQDQMSTPGVIVLPVKTTVKPLER